MAGYSGTPLAKKLGIKENGRLAVVNDPGQARALLEPVPAGVEVTSLTAADVAAGELGRLPIDVVWFFTRARRELADHLDALAAAIRPAAACWISWPKKAAAKRLPTDVTEDVIREVVLPAGDLVDVKVCAVDNWLSRG